MLKPNASIAQVKAVDKDSGENGRVTYSISHNENQNLSLWVDRNGVVKVKSVRPLNGTGLTDPAFRSLCFHVLASDNGTPRHSTSVRLRVSYDENEEPEMDQVPDQSYTLWVSEKCVTTDGVFKNLAELFQKPIFRESSYQLSGNPVSRNRHFLSRLPFSKRGLHWQLWEMRQKCGSSSSKLSKAINKILEAWIERVSLNGGRGEEENNRYDNGHHYDYRQTNGKEKEFRDIIHKLNASWASNGTFSPNHVEKLVRSLKEVFHPPRDLEDPCGADVTSVSGPQPPVGDSRDNGNGPKSKTAMGSYSFDANSYNWFHLAERMFQNVTKAHSSGLELLPWSTLHRLAGNGHDSGAANNDKDIVNIYCFERAFSQGIHQTDHPARNPWEVLARFIREYVVCDSQNAARHHGSGGQHHHRRSQRKQKEEKKGKEKQQQQQQLQQQQQQQ
ncbi:uncharacterized protein LOC101846886, partial [Aplysia californica]|uniref:Uncharacterized protein LOC101846886 n=1 Tax=Aplysia californica TaxID=6500 RepID=A0ABM1A128_APLCA